MWFNFYMTLQIYDAFCKRKVIECSESHNKDIFDAIRCSFGALVIITEITIRCEPLQHLEYFQYPMRFEAVMRDFKKLANSAGARMFAR